MRSTAMSLLRALLLTTLGALPVLPLTAPAALAACSATVSIACGEAHNGSIAVIGEEDCFTFTAVQTGETVSIHELQTAAGYNTCVELLDPTSASLGSTCGGELERTLGSAGTYTIKVYEYGNDSTGSYDVSLTVVSDTASSCAVPLSCGQTLAGSIAAPTESDTFSFAARAGDVVSVTTTETGPGLNACWEVYTPAGASLGGQCGADTKVLTTAGNYTIRVYDNGNDDTGLYDINLAVVSESASNCGEPIACGQTLSRTIGAVAESDTFTFATLLPNEAVRVATGDQGLALNACWQLYDPTGGVLGSACDLAGDVVLSAPGTHTISVSDEFDNATGDYDVSLQCLGSPTPALTMTATPLETPTPSATASSTPTPADTDAPTATPIATGATPTSTPSPSPTLTPTPSAAATETATAISTPSASPTAAAQPTPPPGLENRAAAKAATACQKTITKAGGALVSTRLGQLGKCAGALFACTQAKAGDLARCFASAHTRCTRSLAKIAAARAKLTGAIGRKCEPVGGLDLLRAPGLGYERLGSTCLSEFTTALADASSIAECLARQHECRTDQLFVAQLPRAGELLRVHGVALAADSCLANLGGDGAGLGDPKGEGKALDKCRKRITAAGRSFATTALKRFQKCTDAAFTCIQLKPGEDTCLARAQRKCTQTFAKLDGDTAKLRAAIDRACRPLSPSTLVSETGANAGALAGVCAPYGVSPVETLTDYADCLARQHLCHAEDFLRFESPRAEELIEFVRASLPGPCLGP